MKADGSDEEIFVGNHMDVLDCSVCHVYKEQMVVRSLDSTSGHRYPGMLGFKEELGLLGMFSDPMNMGLPAGNNLQEWTPLYIWQRKGNDQKILPDGTGNPNYRRKVYTTNPIVAILWNNVDPLVDANGDGVNGRHPVQDLTYYDPWISRDMKAGLNFGPSGFAPVPVGFGFQGDGITGGAYQSAYAPNGTFTGAWNYVGVYGGNITFSTPEEISGYKAWRTATGSKSWDGTQLSFLAGPFMITHGVQSTNKYVRGDDCTDCHGAADFFSGGFNMTGTAIKADAGDHIMNPQQSPTEILEVVGLNADIETAAEVATKAGVAKEIHFDEHVDWDPATKSWTPNPAGNYKHVVDLDRAEAMYPEETSYTAVDGTVYADRAAWVAYLNSLTDPLAVGIGVAPVAEIGAVNAGQDIEVGSSVLMIADLTNQPATGTYTYTWSANDGGEVVTGAPTFRTFDTLGTWNVVLTATDEEGLVAQDNITVNVVAPAPPAAAEDIASTDNGTGAVQTVTFANLTTPHTKININWGDGYKTSVASSAEGFDMDHTFAVGRRTVPGPSGNYEYTVEVSLINGRTNLGVVTSAVVQITP